MDQYFALKVRSARALLTLNPHLELRVSHSSPAFVEAVHLVPVERVAHVGSPARLTLVHAKVEPPRLHDGLEAE